MFYVKPDFFDSFVCKADKCTDTCCAGWEIIVDDDTYSAYQKLNDADYAHISDGIDFDSEGNRIFRLKECERCWFLNDNGLCDIYSRHGENALCDICREHPRFYNWYDNATESGLGLCCEKVCEMLFDADTRFGLISSGEKTEDDYFTLYDLREKCFSLLKDDKKCFEIRISDLLDYAVSAESELFDYNCRRVHYEDRLMLFEDVIDLFSETEAINSEWTSLIEGIRTHIDEILKISENHQFDINEYKKFISYVIYRNLIESTFSNGFTNGIAFAVASLVFLHMCDCYAVLKKGEFSISDRIDNVKMWSKQIEYNEENVDLLNCEAVKLFFI